MESLKKHYWIIIAAIVSAVLILAAPNEISAYTANHNEEQKPPVSSPVIVPWDPRPQVFSSLPDDPTVPLGRYITFKGREYVVYYVTTGFDGADSDYPVDKYQWDNGACFQNVYFSRETGRLIYFQEHFENKETPLSAADRRNKALEDASLMTGLDLMHFTIAEVPIPDDRFVYYCIYGSEDKDTVLANTFAFSLDSKGNFLEYQHAEVVMLRWTNGTLFPPYYNKGNIIQLSTIVPNTAFPNPTYIEYLRAVRRWAIEQEKNIN